MIFTTSITVPAATPQTTPLEQTLQLTACTIDHVCVVFPAGCYWLVGLRATLREHQLYPTNPDAWLVGNDLNVTFSDATAIEDTPCELLLTAYNLDERYEHTIYLYLDVSVLSPAGSAPYVPDIYSGYV